VRPEFMQRLSTVLHGTLGSYLRDALNEGSVDVVACLRVSRAWVFFLFLLGNLRRSFLSFLSLFNVKSLLSSLPLGSTPKFSSMSTRPYLASTC
jgi:hypothetical protein